MSNELDQRIMDSPKFHYLVTKRSRFAWLLSFIILFLYVGIILLIAFAPGWLGTPLSATSSITRGIPVGVGMILISFMLTGLYVFRANGEFDRLNAELLHEVKDETL